MKFASIHNFNKFLEKLNLTYLIVFIILLAIPLTQFLVKEDQSLQKEASEISCTTSLVEASTDYDPLDFTYPPLCQAAESHEIAGQLEGCDDYHIGWWCSPKENTTQQMVTQSCRGWANPLTSSYKVHFRNRVNYIHDTMLQNLLNSSNNSQETRKRVWNSLMNEVKAENTTFGIQNPQEDLEFASRQIFNLSWEEVKIREQQINCPILKN